MVHEWYYCDCRDHDHDDDADKAENRGQTTNNPVHCSAISVSPLDQSIFLAEEAGGEGALWMVSIVDHVQEMLTVEFGDSRQMQR